MSGQAGGRSDVGAPFKDLTTLTQRGDDTFDATIADTWTIGPKVHGGAMMALCGAAAVRRLGVPDVMPLAVGANYLNAPDPGPVSLNTVVRKQGRRVSHIDVELSQNDRPAVRAVVTLGIPDSEDPRHTVGSLSMPVDPPPGAQAIGPGHPMAEIVHVATGCEMRIDPSSAHFLTGSTGESEIRLWVRPRPDDEADPTTAALFAIMTGDISPPATMNRGMFGWAPTVQLTTYLRRRPAPGWLRVVASSTVIGETWFEEDHTVVDSTGAVVVQSRQLAMVPLR
ncbi:thioesterase family protein [Actinomycetes bacterium M1A6_2h]